MSIGVHTTTMQVSQHWTEEIWNQFFAIAPHQPHTSSDLHSCDGYAIALL